MQPERFNLNGLLPPQNGLVRPSLCSFLSIPTNKLRQNQFFTLKVLSEFVPGIQNPMFSHAWFSSGVTLGEPLEIKWLEG